VGGVTNISGRSIEPVSARPDLIERLGELRGWTPAAMERLGLGWDRDRVVFPVRDATGDIVGRSRYEPDPTRRNGKPKLLAEPGTPRELFPPPETVGEQEGDGFMWLVEGEPDAVRGWSIGLAAVAVPGAQNWKSQWAPRFVRRRVVVCFDADEAGRAGARSAADHLATAGIDVRIVDLQPGDDDGSDLTDFLKSAGTAPEMAEQARRLLREIAERHQRVVPALRSCDKRERRGNASSADNMALPALPPWTPPQLGAAALHGLAGRYCEFVKPYTEASTAGVLGGILVAFGSAVGKNAFIEVGATTHHPNEFVLLIGPTATGRKGDTMNVGIRVLTLAAPDWAERIRGGFGSGEAIVEEVRDASDSDEGADDKRLLIKEGEVALAFAVAQRSGSTLSSTWRNAWDGSRLENRTKGARLVASNAHVSVLAGVTPDELMRLVGATELANGFLNRFLLVAVRRERSLPRPRRIPGDVEDEYVSAFAAALEFARTVDVMGFDDESGAAWDHAYDTVLSVDRPGLSGAACSRAEAHTLRLAMLFALLDKSSVIQIDHVRAALAFWAFCEQSAVLVFGNRLGNQTADRILDGVVAAAKGGLSRDEIRSLFSGHRSREELDLAIGQLLAINLIEEERRETGGRPETRYRITQVANDDMKKTNR
jgi:hypothetical protein